VQGEEDTRMRVKEGPEAGFTCSRRATRGHSDTRRAAARSIAGTAAAQEAGAGGDMRWFFGRGGAHAQQAATCGPPRAGRAASHGYRLPAGVRAQRVRRKGVVSAPAWSSALLHVPLCRRKPRRRAI
jgi:hypothetical protein